MTGRVKIYNKNKGYGIITSCNIDYFFMWTDIECKGHKHCHVGEEVSFKPIEHDRGMRATQVKVL